MINLYQIYRKNNKTGKTWEWAKNQLLYSSVNYWKEVKEEIKKY